MKNLISTALLRPNNNFDVQSELFIDHTGLLIYQPAKTKVSWTDCAYKNLYIISEREIKVGDSVLHERGWIGKVRTEKYSDAPEVEVDWFGAEKEIATSRTSLIYIKKIELTTDAYLIKNGVPAIDENTKAICERSYECGGKDFEVNFLTEFCKRWNEKGGKETIMFDAEKLYIKKGNQKRVDVEEFAKNKYGIHDQSIINAFVDGFEHNQALQSNAVGYSLPTKEDWKKIESDHIDWFFEKRKLTSSDEEFLWFKARMIKWFEQSAKEQPKGDIVIECEMEEILGKPYMAKGRGIEISESEWKIKLNQHGQPTLIFK